MDSSGMCGNKAGSITPHTSPGGGDCMSACKLEVLIVCRLSMLALTFVGWVLVFAVKVTDLIKCRVTWPGKAVNSTHRHTHTSAVHTQTDTFSVDLRIWVNLRVALKVLWLLVFEAGSSTWTSIFRQIVHHRGAKSTSTNPQRPERELEDKFVYLCLQACVCARMWKEEEESVQKGKKRREKERWFSKDLSRGCLCWCVCVIVHLCFFS